MPTSVVPSFSHLQYAIHIRILVTRRFTNWPRVTHAFAIPYTRGVGQRGVGELGARDAGLREGARGGCARVFPDQRRVVAPQRVPVEVEALRV